MRVFKRIYHKGVCTDEKLYKKLIALDNEKFGLGKFEFKPNRTWWVLVVDGAIMAYCGVVYTQENACLFNRAWVHIDLRGVGIHRDMIDLRVRRAKSEGCDCCITYTSIENYRSANNLFKKGFRLYRPAFEYVGKNMLYFKKSF